MLFIVLAVLQAPQVHANISAQEKLQLFLSDVIEIDLASYNITQSGYGASYPPKYGGLVKEEAVSYTFSTDNNAKLDVNSIFDNGKLCSCDINPIKGEIQYKDSEPVSILNTAKSVMQKYQTYASTYYAFDISYLQAAQSMLNNIAKLASTSTVKGAMQLEVKQFTEPLVPQTMYTTIKWSYVENGTVMPRKSISLHFQNSTLKFFSDCYGLYEVGSLGNISMDEAFNLGFAAAKSYNVSVVSFGENKSVTITYVKTDWSNYTCDIFLSMIPGDEAYAKTINPPAGYNSSLPPFQARFPSNVTRDPLALYPLWQMVFYFNKSIGNIAGIQVGVWGDSKELSYCNEYSYLGSSTPLPSADQSSLYSVVYGGPSPSSAISRESTGLLDLSLPIAYSYLMIFVVIAAAMAIGSYVILRRKR